jgi:hypothetical protein
MVLVQSPGGPSTWPEDALVGEVFAGRLHPDTPVSFDGGASWLAAGLAAQRLRARGDDALAVFIPTRIEPWSMAAGYVAIFSGLFFGGPISFLAAVLGFDPGPTVLVRLITVLVCSLLGPLPPALMGWLGLRGLRRDPTYRGKGRAVFALVVAGLMAVPCLIGLVGVVIRH